MTQQPNNLARQETIKRKLVQCRDCGKWINYGIKRTRYDMQGRIYVDYICAGCIANPPEGKMRQKVTKQRVSV